MKVDSLTGLVKTTGISLNAASINQALIKAGLAEEVEYASTSGSGEIKKYVRLTGTEYGINRATMHEFRTEMRFYPNRFPDLLRAVARQITTEAESL